MNKNLLAVGVLVAVFLVGLLVGLSLTRPGRWQMHHDGQVKLDTATGRSWLYNGTGWQELMPAKLTAFGDPVESKVTR